MKQLNKLLSAFSTKTLMLLSFFALLPTMASAQCPDNNHPHMIDLGLPSGTKWACCNVGASKPEDYGGYFAWGETEEKDVYDWSTYLYGTYNEDEDYSNLVDIGIDIAGSQYDVAHVQWGASWRMPSQEQVQEFIDNCNSIWGTINGVNGWTFTGPNGSTIFLPAAGLRANEELIGGAEWGQYYSSSLLESYPCTAHIINIFKEEIINLYAAFRYYGFSVRPVVAGSNQGELQDGDIFTAWTEDGVELTYRVISAAEKTCQVGGGDPEVRACDVNTTGTVTVPEVAKGFQVITVGGYAFYECSGLTQITLPETIKTIKYCAFEGCSGLTSFTIPSSVTSFSGNHQWNGCTGLTSIHIPANVWSMGNHTFAFCPNILEVTVDENNPVFESPAGSHAIINKSKKSVVQGFKNTVIPEGITYIESAAFVGNEYNDIVLPKSFGGFYWDAFQFNAVRSITVAEGNTLFDSRNNCNALMETATDKLVKGCANTVIPSETKVIGEWAFAYSYGNGHPSPKTVVLPEGVTKIENWAFGYCLDLEEVTIPSTVTEIMYNAFVGSDNMKKLVSFIQEPFALGEYAFDGWQNENITLYVPKGTKSLYEATEGWKEFKNIVEMEDTPSGIAIDETNFPDENFRNWVLAQDYGQDGVLTEEEIAGVTSIDVSDKNIADLKGIEYFTELKFLNCYDNQLISLDVSMNTALIMLNCFGNQLTSLDVSMNMALIQLSCSNNQLTSLDLSRNTTLATLGCGNNKLTSLDISQNTALTSLSCDYTQLTSLDVSHNTALIELTCYGNQLTTLDVSQNTALEFLQCGNNQLTMLDVTKNISLTRLYCHYNQLTSLDVSKSTALTMLLCHNNQLTSLDFSRNTVLEYLDCYCNNIKGAAMDALIASLPGKGGSFYAISPSDEVEQNVVTKAQVAAAKEKGWKTYYYSYETWNWEEYEGSEQEMDPISNGETIDIGNEIDENTSLDGNVVGDVYYSISSGDGNYDAAEGCLVVTKPTDDSAIDGQDIFGEDFKDNYTGIVFKLAPGKGSIKVEAETQGNMVLKVKIGNSEPIEMELDGKLKVKFPYNVSEPTYVYIYGGMGAAGAKAMGANRAKSAADLLKIYGFEIVSDPSGIDAIENGQQQDAPVYNLNGQRVNTPGKGIYIKNGRKVLMK